MGGRNANTPRHGRHRLTRNRLCKSPGPDREWREAFLVQGFAQSATPLGVMVFLCGASRRLLARWRELLSGGEGISCRMKAFDSSAAKIFRHFELGRYCREQCAALEERQPQTTPEKHVCARIFT